MKSIERRRNQIIRRYLLVALIVALLVLAAVFYFNQDEPSPEPTPTSTLTPSLTAVPPTATSTPTVTVSPTPYPIDPTQWTLRPAEGEVAKYLGLYLLEDWQTKFIIPVVNDFYQRLYRRDSQLVLDEFSEIVAPDSIAWQQLELIHQKYIETGRFAYIEFPLEDANRYRDWKIRGSYGDDGVLSIYVSFWQAEQVLYVLDANDLSVIQETSRPYYGPLTREYTLQFINGRWMIIDTEYEYLGTLVTNTPESADTPSLLETPQNTPEPQE